MLDNEKLKEILLSQNYLTADDLAKASASADSYKMTLYDALLTENIISRSVLGQAIAEYYNVPFVDLSKMKIDPAMLALVPEGVARTYRFLPIAKIKEGFQLAMVDPGDLTALHLAEKKLGQKALPSFVLPEDLEMALGSYGAGLAEEFGKVIEAISGEDVSLEEHDDAIIKLVDLLLEKGYRNKASDIHIEPHTKDVIVRFRIDGVMHLMLKLDKVLSETLVSRIKIMAHLRTDEHRSSQDGKLRFTIDNNQVDVRVSIVPIAEGENAVLRILASHSQNLTLPNLGLNDRNFKAVKKAIKRPHGMILVTGPTGSGKTTTLYAVLTILNRVEVHIATIEDPVEYAIDGISQIQVDSKTNLTFAAGLRSILRQDPDIIMVGEIRDKETANIAINSALTGHLVLSTLHTNDAATSLPRLIDMDVEPYLVASTVNIIIAQRLVRKNCENCRVSRVLLPEELAIIENEPHIKQYLKDKGYKTFKKINVYRGRGCKICDNTGYQGRIGIFEILEVDDRVRKMIMDKRDSMEIMDEARKRGMNTMMEDGLDKVLAGTTSLDEILRVTRD